MKDLFVSVLVRSRMALTSRERATRQIERLLLDYRGLYAAVGEGEARQPFTVPPMLGIDEEMRSWSLYMILEHNIIVNRVITAIVQSLATGAPLPPEAQIDPRRDVLPSAHPGPEQLPIFRESVERYLQAVAELPKLRGTAKKRHPVFGQLDAHGWHCMFGLHLQIHFWQAEEVVRVMSRPPQQTKEGTGAAPGAL